MPPQTTILGLGEILWDVFPDGPRFGGAPANFACSVAGLAGNAVNSGMVSAVGQDDLGTQALDELRQHGVSTATVARYPQQTGQVLVSLDADGHASYEFASDVAWDHLEWSDDIETIVAKADAVCFGTLGQRTPESRTTIQHCLRSVPETCLKIFDINLRPPFWSEEVIRESLPLANVLKLNDDELPILADIHGFTGTAEAQLALLVERYSLKFAALTQGSKGALIIDANGNTSQQAAPSTTVKDTVGAGDSFTAALALGLLHGMPLDEINQWAIRVAAFVCSQPGATPSIPEELQLSSQK
ncbi:MAG: carbohydrate kinase [Planctomycetaceae bacterium]|nr:carbohydrate kinase [Planctomycetaceae bacterium]